MTIPLLEGISTSDFAMRVAAPENRDKHLELIHGEVSEKMVSSPQSSGIGILLGGIIAIHVRVNRLGWVTDGQGGYHIGTDRYIPDAAFVTTSRMNAPVEGGYLTVAPDLAIEVISPSDQIGAVTQKVFNYVAVGCVVWLVDPLAQTLTVYTPGQAAVMYRRHETLRDEVLLPGLVIDLALIF